MTIERILYLHRQYLAASLNAEEHEELRNALADPKLEQLFQDFAEAKWNEPEYGIPAIPASRAASIYDRIIGDIQRKRPVKLWPRIAVAATIAFVITAGAYFYYNLQNAKMQQYTVDFAPGKAGATLTLANGKKIKLSDVASGELVKQVGIRITKTVDGQLVYELQEQSGEHNTGANRTETNTLTTAKGETYVLILPDKSKVWMNAASSLTYAPRLNTGRIRKVKLDGEAYFEISKDKEHPFIVESEGQQVEVLGTHFNINSYPDEPAAKTTLLEGSVAISLLREPKEKQMLKPGQQATVSVGGFNVKAVNVEEAIAWRNGYFQFDQESLESVMRKLSRWYNVNVSFENQDVKKIKFSGTMSKYAKISQILQKIASVSEIYYTIKGKDIIINKKE